jgi:hypothetical protein
MKGRAAATCRGDHASHTCERTTKRAMRKDQGGWEVCKGVHDLPAVPLACALHTVVYVLVGCGGPSHSRRAGVAMKQQSPSECCISR